MPQHSIPCSYEVLAEIQYCPACDKPLSIDQTNNKKVCQRCNIRYVLDDNSFTAPVSPPTKIPSRVLKDSNTDRDAERGNGLPASTYYSAPTCNSLPESQTPLPRGHYGGREDVFRSVCTDTIVGTCTSINISVTRVVGYVTADVQQLQGPLCSNCPGSNLHNVKILGGDDKALEVQCEQCGERWGVPRVLMPRQRRMVTDCQNCGKRQAPKLDFRKEDGTHVVICQCGVPYVLENEGTGMTRMIPEHPHVPLKRAESLPAFTRTDYEMKPLIQQFSVTEQAKELAWYENGGNAGGKLKPPLDAMASTYYNFHSSQHHYNPQNHQRAQGYPQPHYAQPPSYATKAPAHNPIDAARPFVNAVGGLIGKGVGPKRAGFVEEAIGVVDAGLQIGAAVDRRKKGQIGKATLGHHMGAGVAGIVGNVGQFALNFVPFGRAIGGAVPAVANFIGKPIGNFIAKLMK